jgi:hypothetical protein
MKDSGQASHCTWKHYHTTILDKPETSQKMLNGVASRNQQVLHILRMCVRVALIMQHAKLMHHIILYYIIEFWT